MKNLSLKLDDQIFQETETLTLKLNVARNRYINEALYLYNKLNMRRLLKNQLLKESTMTRDDSMEILRELEQMTDGDQAI
jgi:hypothetical protein